MNVFKEQLRHQVSFVYTECSDVTEVYFIEPQLAQLVDELDIGRELPVWREETLFYTAEATAEARSKWRSSAKLRSQRSVRFRREEKTSRLVRSRKPASTLLTTGQYQKRLSVEKDPVGQVEALHGCSYEAGDPAYLLKPPPPPPPTPPPPPPPLAKQQSCLPYRSTLTAQTSRGKSPKNQVECHVVGDLLSFASNTMRLVLLNEISLILWCSKLAAFKSLKVFF